MSRFFVFLCLLVSLPIKSQNFWATYQGGFNVDETIGITADAQGNTYGTGYFSTSAEISGVNLSVDGLTDIFVTKTDPAGGTLWSVGFGGNQSDRGLGIAVDNAGNTLVCGFYSGTVNFGDGVSLSSESGSQDAFILKLNSSGNPVWARSGGSTGGSDRANAVAVDPSGNVIITGQFSGEASFGSLSLNADDGTVDAFIVKYDADGNEIWAKRGSGESLDRGLGVAADNSGAVYAVGQFSGDVEFDNTYSNTIQNAAFIIKFSASGDEEWFRWGGGSEECIAYGIDSDGSNVFITGDFGQSANFFGDGSPQALSSGFDQSIFVISYAPDGSYAWGTAAGSDSDVSSRGIDFGGGGLAIAGWYECRLNTYSEEYGEATFNSLGFKDCYVAMYSTSGSFDYARNFGSVGDEVCSDVVQLPDGLSALSGNFQNELILPVGVNPIFGLGDLISQPNFGITHCGDSNYGNFRALEGSGGQDGFILKVLNPERSPFDFYHRTDGACDLSIPDACIYKVALNIPAPIPCPESIEGCAPFEISGTPMTLGGIMDYNSTFSWTPTGAVDSFTTVDAAGTYSVNIQSQDGCFTSSASTEVEVLPSPDPPLISDSEGVNNMSASGNPIFICPGESVEIWADLPPGTQGNWTGSPFVVSPDYDVGIIVSESGSYFINATNPEGCQASNVVTVIIEEVPPDLPPLIVAADSVVICEGASFNVELVDSISMEGYPIQEYILDWGISGQGSISGGTFASVEVDDTGWYEITASLTSVESPCLDTLIEQFALDSVFVIVEANPDVFANISGPDFICDNDTITLYLEHQGELSYNFNVVEDFGDSLYVTGTGTYTITAEETNEAGCSAIASDSVIVSSVETPSVQTIPQNAVICPDDSVQIVAEALGEILWQGPDGIFEGDSSIYVQESGFYFAEVVFYEGCALVSNTVEVTEYTTPLLEGSADVLCPGGEVEISLVSSSVESIDWQAPLSGSDTVQVVSEPGIYSVLVTGCNQTSEIFIEVLLTEYELEIDLADDSPTCDGDSILVEATEGLENYEWSPEGTGQTTWFSEAGSVQATAVDEYGCSLSSNVLNIEFEMTPSPPDFQFEPPCEGEALLVFVQSDLTVSFFDNATGEILTNEDSVFIESFSEDSTFFAFLSTEICQGNPDSVTISPIPFPEDPIPISDSPVCTGANLTLEILNAESDVNYIWAAPNGDELSGSEVSLGISNADQAGLYSAYADREGCLSDTAATEVEVFETVQVYLPPDTTLCFRSAFPISPDTVFATYQWHDSSSGPSFLPSQSGSILLTVTDFNGCESGDVMNIEFADCTVDVPNIFTPNGDGRNDGWSYIIDRPLRFEVVVYNRWGRIVYESNNHLLAWDGIHYKSNEPCSEGTYFYIMQGLDFEAQPFEQTGTITLIRE